MATLSYAEHLRDLVIRCKNSGVTLKNLSIESGVPYDTLCTMRQGGTFYLSVDDGASLHYVITGKHFINPKNRRGVRQ
jgi:hypothetical protein